MTLVVYPALVAVDSRAWQAAHDAHGRAITPVVVLTYGLLLLACLWALVTMPDSPGVWVAATGAALSMGATALVAAPAHGALSGGPTPHTVRRLIVADRARLFGAIVAAGGALAVSLVNS